MLVNFKQEPVEFLDSLLLSLHLNPQKHTCH